MKKILVLAALAASALTSCCGDRCDPCNDSCPPRPRCCEPRPCCPRPVCPPRCEPTFNDNCCY